MVLNEEQWIKELREKRIAYGISQGRLALASGITREYLNKIESGKMKPSKELLETLHKELARFNPEAPLTMLFDYVKIRFPTLDIQHIIKDILKLNINYMLHEDYGHYGNMFYVEVVNQYLAVPQVSGELAQKVMNEALKYQGWKYVYGGSNPNTSFDCSGLTQWCYGKAGISLPRTAQAQYDATQHLPLSQAKAGDLVFFHSTYNAGSYVTHVGILVSPTQMYHAGDPIGYADLSSSYWQQHLIGAGRVKQ